VVVHHPIEVRHPFHYHRTVARRFVPPLDQHLQMPKVAARLIHDTAAAAAGV
jgi:hypothetical protein